MTEVEKLCHTPQMYLAIAQILISHHDEIGLDLGGKQNKMDNKESG